MKTRKWLWWTFAIVSSLAVLGFTGLAGFRVGFQQGATAVRTALKDIEVQEKPQAELPVPPPLRGPENREFQKFPGQHFERGQGFDGRNFRRLGGFSGFPFFSPLFGLIQLAVLVLIIWVVYKLIRNSGWRLTRAPAEPASADSDEPASKKRLKRE